jgi:hypothetical protein
MLDREPCKNGEWLSDMGNVDVSAPELEMLVSELSHANHRAEPWSLQ